MIDIYLACPYTQYSERERELVFEQVSHIASQLCRAGITVFSPISHSHPIARYGLPATWKFWERFDTSIMTICKIMVICCLEGWENSKGLYEEKKFFDSDEIILSENHPGMDNLIEEIKRRLEK